MEYIIIVVLLIFMGGLLSFFSNILDTLSQEEINMISDDEFVVEKLNQLSVKHENSKLGLNFLEVTLYLFASAFLGIFSFLQFQSLNIIFYLITGMLVYILLQRSLFIGLSLRFSRLLAPKLYRTISILYKIVYPISSVYLLAVRKFSSQSDDEATRDEINALVETAMEDGSIDEDEYRLMKNIMHFSDIQVADVMTPRTVLFSYQADKTVGEVINVAEIQMYSRFPIWEGKLFDDGIVGYVVTKEILTAALDKKLDNKLRKYAREIHYIPENATLDSALEQFIKLRQHILLVVDEYGGVEGLLSLEDILESILGVEIVDEADRVVDLRDLAKQRRDKRVRNMIPQVPDNENNSSIANNE